MLQNILYSINTVAPIFIMVIVGFILKKIKFLSNDFFDGCDKIGFKVCLPCLLFVDIAYEDISKSLDVKLIGFCIIGVTCLFLAASLLSSLFIRDNAKRGAFIQGMCRSNAAILGVTVATNMFGDLGAATIAMVLPFIVVLYNVYSVILLSVFAPAEVKPTGKQLVLRITKNVVTNPLIIATALALIWNALKWEMPLFADRSLNYLAEMSVPLALISLGANFDVQSLQGRLGLATISATFKTVIVPLIAVACAYFFGIRTVGLGIVLILFGGPTAVSSYIMAKQMGSDYNLAGQILLISTFMSAFTLFFGIFLLKSINLV